VAFVIFSKVQAVQSTSIASKASTEHPKKHSKKHHIPSRKHYRNIKETSKETSKKHYRNIKETLQKSKNSWSLDLPGIPPRKGLLSQQLDFEKHPSETFKVIIKKHLK
jgi:hypothetical protein